jgi:hypothetical protein
MTTENNNTPMGVLKLFIRAVTATAFTYFAPAVHYAKELPYLLS